MTPEFYEADRLAWVRFQGSAVCACNTDLDTLKPVLEFKTWWLDDIASTDNVAILNQRFAAVSERQARRAAAFGRTMTTQHTAIPAIEWAFCDLCRTFYWRESNRRNLTV